MQPIWNAKKDLVGPKRKAAIVAIPIHVKLVAILIPLVLACLAWFSIQANCIQWVISAVCDAVILELASNIQLQPLPPECSAATPPFSHGQKIQPRCGGEAWQDSCFTQKASVQEVLRVQEGQICTRISSCTASWTPEGPGNMEKNPSGAAVRHWLPDPASTWTGWAFTKVGRQALPSLLERQTSLWCLPRRSQVQVLQQGMSLLHSAPSSPSTFPDVQRKATPTTAGPGSVASSPPYRYIIIRLPPLAGNQPQDDWRNAVSLRQDSSDPCRKAWADDCLWEWPEVGGRWGRRSDLWPGRSH